MVGDPTFDGGILEPLLNDANTITPQGRFHEEALRLDEDRGRLAYQAIDDVMACRKAGQLELTQVMFTPTPQRPDRRLSWEWLTWRKPNATSFLQKWAKSGLAHKGDGRQAQAMLKTDRMPDPELAQCLNGSRVDYLRLTRATKETVDDQIGSEEASREFFEVFE